MALPCFSGKGGPFATRKGEIRGDVAAAERPALATLYLALMTDLSLTRLGALRGDLIVEGSFATNDAYCGLLAALRPSQTVLTAQDAAGTARGAALLASWPPSRSPKPTLTTVAPLRPPGLEAYRQDWVAAID
jgi:sugar (pentulose or hexulose) kinase